MLLKQRALLFVVLVLLLAAGAYFVVRFRSLPFGGQAMHTLPRPVITIAAVYPGANAQVLADTVAAPIEQQVLGVLNMRSMQSRSGNDGTYTLNVTFEHGADLDMAQVLIQNRVSLAY